ncbi:hypothetical protein AB9N12_10400 [Bacteroides sp. AN502(2024)]|uniref:hypothetical protein n=1 Tax=Bacteroides sp. AN502(2024) TaxID=3160599 RepID=UPI0035119ACA
MKVLDAKTIKNNKGIVVNVVAAFGIKGLGMIVNMLSMPLYIDYFGNNMILGLWFTILTVVNWILSFDVGIGNGLRNHLTRALSQKDYEEGKRLTSSAFVSLGAITIVFTIIVYAIMPIVNWNNLFNISTDVVLHSVLARCIGITMIGIMTSFFLHIVRSILFALQLSSIVNLLHLLTSILLVAYLFVAPDYSSVERKLNALSIAYAILINIPSILTLLSVFFFSEMRYCRPRIKYVTKSGVKAIIGLGISFFAVQAMFMIITVTNEWFISKFFSPEYCVDYQIYFRLFALVGSLIMLAMSPLWSAVTKAYSQKHYQWIVKLQKVLNYLALACIAVECVFVILLQPIIDIWLDDRTIEVNYLTASFFLLYGVVMIWVAIQSIVVAGLGTLKVQLRFYLFAAIFKIFTIVVVSQFTDDWSIVVLATALGLLPYCIYQPFVVKKQLKMLELENV